jgi:tetratricopeptide (TPR) repeat protein
MVTGMSDLSSLAEAARFLERGDLAAAERSITALPGWDADPDALHLMALARLQQNRPVEAEKLLKQSLGARPGHPHVLVNLAKLFLAQGRHGEALAALQAALEADPKLTEAWYELAALKFAKGDSRSAEGAFRQVLALEPRHLPARLWLGVTIKNDGRGAEAEPIREAGVGLAREAPLKAAFVYNLAWSQYLQGKKQTALDNFAFAARLDSSLNSDVNCADLLEELGRVEEALALLETVIQREPGNAAAHLAYNNLLHRLGRDGEFLASYDRAPQTASMLAAKAGLLLKRGKPEEAAEIFAQAKTREPGNPEALTGLAAALNALGRHGEAMAALEQALQHQPATAPLYQSLAATALQARDPEKSAAFAEKSLRLSPVDQSGLALLGSAWRMLGDARDEMLNGYDELIGVFDLEPPQGFSRMEDFNRELNAWLAGMHRNVREPLEQSLKGGSQTRGYLFGQGHDLAEQLKARIGEAIGRYIAEIKPDARHPFRGRAGSGFRYKHSWSSRLGDCGFHVNHIHPGGWISSCYYVALPEVVKDETAKQGWIKFGEPGFEIGLAPRRAIQPRPGRLVLFPSYMWHGTIPFHENSTRTTVAFDAVPL